MTQTHSIRVMAVDDHPLMMAGIVGEINAQADMRVVAEASDGDEARSAFSQTPSRRYFDGYTHAEGERHRSDRPRFARNFHMRELWY
jgi:hypothetical protein